MSSDQNQKLARRFFDEMCNGRKLNTATELFTPGHVYHDPSAPTGPGPDGMKQVIGAYQTAYSDAEWTVNDMFAADGERVIVLWTGSGTQSGEANGHHADQEVRARRRRVDLQVRERQDRRELEPLGFARHATAARRGADAGGQS
jgi:hypothetical protein